MRPNDVFTARLALALAIVMAGCNPGTAAELAIPQRPAPKAISREPPKDVSIQTGPPNCARWTDECVSCTRGVTAEAPVCSNIGFACQPKAIRCLGAQ
jgi:hypothetical protein